MTEIKLNMWPGEFYPDTDSYKEEKLIAERTNQCVDCQQIIEVDWGFYLCSGEWDGEFRAYSICLACHHLRDFLNKTFLLEDTPIFGELLQFALMKYKKTKDRDLSYILTNNYDWN